MADDEIRIRAELSGALERDVEAAARAVDDLGDEAAQTAIQLRIMEAAAGGAARNVDDLNRSSDRASTAARKQRRETEKQTSAYDRMQSILGRIKKMNFDFGMVLKAYKIPLIVTAVTALAGAVSALGAAGYAGVAGLAPLGALLVGYPALLLAAGQGFAAVKIGAMGVGDAVSALASGDAEKAAEALDKLTPSARNFALQLNQLVQGPLRDLRSDVSAALFPGVRRGLEQAVPLIPVLNEGLSGTARVMGSLADNAGRAMGSPLFTGQLRNIMRTNNFALYDMGFAAGDLGRTLLNLVEGFAPVTLLMSEAARNGAAYVRAATEAGLRTGRLSAFFVRAWELGKDFMGVVSDLTVGLFNIGQESQVMGRYLGGSLADGAEAFRKWTDSIQGRASIREWFADAIPAVRETIGLLGDLGRMFGNLAARGDIAPLLAKIRSDLLPALGDLSSNMSTSFGPAIIEATTAVVKFFSALSYTPLAVILQGIADAGNMAIDMFDLLPGPVKAVVATLFALNTAVKLSGGAMGLLARNMAPLGGLFNGLRGSVDATASKMSVMERAGTGIRNAFQQVSFAAASARGDFDRTGTALTGMQRHAATARGAFSGLGSVGRNAIAGLRGAAGGLVGFLGGPWGIALMGAAAVVGIFMSKHAAAEARVDDLTGTLNENTGALTKNTRAMVVNHMQESGALDQARRLGIALEDVTGAALGNEDAYKRVRDQLIAIEPDAKDAMEGNKFLALTLSGASGDAIDLAQAIGKESAALDDAKVAARNKAEAMKGVSEKSRAAVPNINAAARAEGQLERNAARSSGSLRNQAQATADLRAKTLQLHNSFLKAQQGAISYEQAIDDAAKEIRKGARTMDINTQAGRDNRLALMGVAEAAAGVRNEAKRQEALEEARRKIARWADAAGMGTRQANDYANRLIRLADKAKALPPKAKTDVSVTGIDTAEQRLIDLRANLSNITSRTWTIETRLEQAGGGLAGLAGPPRREGGPVGPSRNLVGEAGPELYLNAAKRSLEVVGAGGPQVKTFTDPGWVLPNEVFEAATAPEASPDGRVSSADGHTSDWDLPDVHIHFDGGAVPSASEARAAGREAAKAYAKELDERRIHWRDN